MILVANEKWMLAYEPEKAVRYHVYFSVNSTFKQEAWHGQNLQTKSLLKFFNEREIRRAKAKLAAEKYVSKKFVLC